MNNKQRRFHVPSPTSPIFPPKKKFDVTKTLHPPAQWNVAAAVGLRVSRVLLDRFVPSYSRHNQHSPTWDAGPTFHSHKSRAWCRFGVTRNGNEMGEKLQKPAVKIRKPNTFFCPSKSWCFKSDVCDFAAFMPAFRQKFPWNWEDTANIIFKKRKESRLTNGLNNQFWN